MVLRDERNTALCRAASLSRLSLPHPCAFVFQSAVHMEEPSLLLLIPITLLFCRKDQKVIPEPLPNHSVWPTHRPFAHPVCLPVFKRAYPGLQNSNHGDGGFCPSPELQATLQQNCMCVKPVGQVSYSLLRSQEYILLASHYLLLKTPRITFYI